MRVWNTLPAPRDDGENMALFGEARLVKFTDGKLELRGGSPADRTQAMEWVHRFMADAIFRQGRD